MHLDAARVNRDLLDFIALEIVGVDFNGLAAIGRFGVGGAKGRQQKEGAGKRQCSRFQTHLELFLLVTRAKA